MFPIEAKATVSPSVGQRVARAQWIVVGRIVATENTSEPHRYIVVLDVKHVLKGNAKPLTKGQPPQARFYHEFYRPIDEGPDFRDARWRSDDLIFYLRRHPKSNRLILVDDWFGVQPIVSDVLDQLSKNGIDVRPVTAATNTLLIGVGVLAVLAAATMAIELLTLWQSRIARRAP